ncbi:MAG TPA: hypothetical protein VJJ82_02480 [Candidatus Nanoarchaeia archaeon]|nr:hypothetical protein [Candidatus Nanoarchaeia archaeon]
MGSLGRSDFSKEPCCTVDKFTITDLTNEKPVFGSPLTDIATTFYVNDVFKLVEDDAKKKTVKDTKFHFARVEGEQHSGYYRLFERSYAGTEREIFGNLYSELIDRQKE